MRAPSYTEKPTSYTIQNWWKGTPSGYFQGFAPGIVVSDRPTLGGSTTPDEDGFRVPTAYSLLAFERRNAHGIYSRRKSDGTGNVYSGNLFGALGLNPTAPFGVSAPTSDYNAQALENIALNIALGKAKRKSFDAAVFMAEREQTLRMLHSTVRSLTRSAKTFKRQLRKEYERLRSGKKVKPPRKRNREEDLSIPLMLRNVSKDWTSKWLAVRYGWAPLLSDLYGAVEAYERLVNDSRPTRFNVTGRMGKRHRETSSQNQTLLAGPIRWTVTRDVDASFFVRLDWELPNPTIGALADFGLTNPLSWAWETTRFSFVADWFLSIGNYLDTLDVPLVYKYLGGSGTLRVENNVYASCINTGLSPGGYTTTSLTAQASSRHLSVNRSIYQDPPLGGVEMTLDWSPKQLGLRLTDLISLFRQAVR